MNTIYRLCLSYSILFFDSGYDHTVYSILSRRWFKINLNKTAQGESLSAGAPLWTRINKKVYYVSYYLDTAVTCIMLRLIECIIS